jgi:AraC-like DNA-binding protein
MSLCYDERPSDSPYVDAIFRGRTMGDGSVVRPAEISWWMVFGRNRGQVRSLVVGPWTAAGVVSWTEGAEILWIKFRLGTFMPHLPTRQLLDRETVLPGATSHAFWLKGSAWQFPSFENVETFVDRLARQDVLARDPVVSAVLQDQAPALSIRSVQYRFAHATGVSRSQVLQFERAQRAAALLQRGKSILDTVEEAGYFDQPHLTRSLKHWIGVTPAQLLAQTQ